MKKQHIYLLITVLVMTMTSCSKDDGEVVKEPVKSSAKQITGFVFKAVDNDAITEDVTAILNETNKTISATVANGTDVTSLTPTIIVSDKAVVDQSGAKDFSSPVEYAVTAEDGTKTIYKTTVSIASNNAKQLISFAFKIEHNELYGDDTISATIDEGSKTITASVSYSANATLLIPSIEVSPNASVWPEIAQDFSDPVIYTVTAEDGSTTEYQVTLEITFTDRDALIAIYNANPNNELGWDLQDKNISTWSWVLLDSDGNINELLLFDKKLDILPPEIGRLPYLQYLFLNGNLLESVPESIGNLSSLIELSLGFNKLTFLPEEIGKLSNLQNLEVEDNQLKTLPATIGQLSKLNNIYLYNNKLTTLPPEIGNLTNLITVFVFGNNLTSLPKEIVGLTGLLELGINDNNFANFPMEIIQLKSLTHLHLSRNQLTSIPKELGNLSNLKGLFLSENQFIYIPKELGNLTGLRSLDLTTNLLTSIPKEVCDLSIIGTSIRLDPDVKCE